ncbi:MAG: hypothetical protein MJK04_24495 [Psychrosphaera sp.]|nr:hypothetical protein [Psychrosphaera sp.]
MPNVKTQEQPLTEHTTPDDVRKAALTGDAVCAYFLKHGKMPTNKAQLAEMMLSEQHQNA